MLYRNLFSRAAPFALLVALTMGGAVAQAQTLDAPIVTAPQAVPTLEKSPEKPVSEEQTVMAGAAAAAMAPATVALAVASGAPPAEVAKHIKDAAAAYVLDRNLLEAVAWKESRFRQGAKSGKGAAGIMQLMPSTAKELGVDRHDARQNVFGGAAYLKEMLIRFGGDVSLALAAYNAGPGAVLRHGGVPPFKETRNYVAAITGRVAQMTAAAIAPSAAAATVTGSN